MAKHPVPKKKTSRARGNRRQKAYENKARVRLSNAIQVTTCPTCKTAIRQHHACPDCGFYKGKATFAVAEEKPQAKAEEKIETIKAD